MVRASSVVSVCVSRGGAGGGGGGGGGGGVVSMMRFGSCCPVPAVCLSLPWFRGKEYLDHQLGTDIYR